MLSVYYIRLIIDTCASSFAYYDIANL
jgi:hypothetical protein